MLTRTPRPHGLNDIGESVSGWKRKPDGLYILSGFGDERFKFGIHGVLLSLLLIRIDTPFVKAYLLLTTLAGVEPGFALDAIPNPRVKSFGAE